MPYLTKYINLGSCGQRSSHFVHVGPSLHHHLFIIALLICELALNQSHVGSAKLPSGLPVSSTDLVLSILNYYSGHYIYDYMWHSYVYCCFFKYNSIHVQFLLYVFEGEENDIFKLN